MNMSFLSIFLYFQRIVFKAAVLTYKTLHTQQPLSVTTYTLLCNKSHTLSNSGTIFENRLSFDKARADDKTFCSKHSEEINEQVSE